MRSKPVAELLTSTPAARLVHGDPSARVTGISQDTRQLQRGDLFVAVQGFERNGLEFAPRAVEAGAAAVVTASRTDLAELAAAFYDHPSRHLPVIGITGTDGKTTTTHLLSAVLEAHGLRTGWLTTVNTKIGDDVRPNAVDHTTPEAPVVQRTLSEMLSAGVDVAILETSSHSLALDRVHAVEFKVGVFTNLSPEHINFHGSFEEYRAAKSLLFERLPEAGLAVLNADDPNMPFFRDRTAARVLTYGLDNPAADIRATAVQVSPRATLFKLHGCAVESRLIGRFNIANWLAAYGASTFFGANYDNLLQAALEQQPVPGRMNVVDEGQPFSVVIDFAHTPQALERALDTLRDLGARRVFLVFGLAGGRDAANRPVMGDLAARKSDFFVISMDDPGHEDPSDIALQIASGASGGSFEIELDRRAAIRKVFERAQPGDAVLLAGKGHEQRMVVGDERRPWNDARAAMEVLGELGYSGQAVP